MIKEVLSDGALTGFAIAGLVIFVAVFAGITLWTLTRQRSEIGHWSRLPLEGDDDSPR
jgi:hypothetical protein